MTIIIVFQKGEERGVIDNASHGPATRWRIREATTLVFGRDFGAGAERFSPPRFPDEIGFPVSRASTLC